MRRTNSCDSILDAIGCTPLVKLERLCKDLPGTVFAKAEYLNPGASMKDRIALRIINDAEKEERIKPGSTVIELTSGNTGTGLAIACAVRGYRFIAVMSEGNSPERRQMLKALGAELVLVPQAEGSTQGQVTGEDLALVEEKTAKLSEELGAFRADQFHNQSNVQAHYNGTAEEIWQQMNGKVNVFVSVVGTAGTFIGVARALKEHNPAIKCLAVEPATVPVLAGGPITDQSHKLQGSSYALIPPFWQPELCDGYLTVTDEEAMQTARRLAREEGILAGYTSGGNVAAALSLATSCEPGTSIATLLCDSGMKYLSSDLYK